MLKLIERSECPPDRFRYVFRNDGHRVESFDKDSWFRLIKKHYQDNGYSMPENWREIAEDQICHSLPPGWCLHEDGSDPKTFINRRFDVSDAINGTKVLIEFVRQGAPLVSQEVAEERAATCAACYALMSIPGCGACVAFGNYVADVAGARKTKADYVLETKVCGVCHCSAKGNVWVPVSVSKVAVTDEMLASFPKEWCWKYKEIMALSEHDNSGLPKEEN